MDTKMIKKMVHDLFTQSVIQSRKIETIEEFLFRKFKETKERNFTKYDSQRVCCEFNVKVISALLGTDYYESEEGVYILKDFQLSNNKDYRVGIDQINKYIYVFEFIFFPERFSTTNTPNNIYVRDEKNINVDDFRTILESAITKPLGTEDFRRIVAMAEDLEDRRRKKSRNKKIKKWLLVIGGTALVVIGGAIVFDIFCEKKENSKKENDDCDEDDFHCSIDIINENSDIGANKHKPEKQEKLTIIDITDEDISIFSDGVDDGVFVLKDKDGGKVFRI